jgi:ATP-dependent Lhr-like helicase
LPEILQLLIESKRASYATIAGEKRYFAAEDAGKLRDALGVPLEPGLPSSFLGKTEHALREVLSRYARTHAPFGADAPAERYGLGRGVVETALAELESAGRVVRGEFLPGGHEVEWCDRNVLRLLKQRSLAKLRRAIEPVAPDAFVRLLLTWQGAQEPTRSPDALERAIDQLQGVPLAASVLVEEVLPARVRGFSPAALDGLLATGEVTWVGVEPHGASDGKVALYRTEQLPLLCPAPTRAPGELAAKLREELERAGAIFFADLQRRVGGFPRDVLAALWELVWSGEVTNDTHAPLRSLREEAKKPPRTRPERRPTARRASMPGSEGRWSLLRRGKPGSVAEQRMAQARLLLDRYGVVSREIVNADEAASFADVYPVLKALEETGKVRRGYFVAGLGGAQFAEPGADERLRAKPESKPAVVLAATDPANPYGAALAWPGAEPRPQRTPGAQVVLYRGRLLAYLSKGDRSLYTFLQPDEPERSHERDALLAALRTLVGPRKRRVLLIEQIDGTPAHASKEAGAFVAAGFSGGAGGLQLRAAGLPVSWDDEPE